MAGTEVWCNGSTWDFGSSSPGSNPGISTEEGWSSTILLQLRYVTEGRTPQTPPVASLRTRHDCDHPFSVENCSDSMSFGEEIVLDEGGAFVGKDTGGYFRLRMEKGRGV